MKSNTLLKFVSAHIRCKQCKPPSLFLFPFLVLLFSFWMAVGWFGGSRRDCQICFSNVLMINIPLLLWQRLGIDHPILIQVGSKAHPAQSKGIEWNQREAKWWDPAEYPWVPGEVKMKQQSQVVPVLSSAGGSGATRSILPLKPHGHSPTQPEVCDTRKTPSRSSLRVLFFPWRSGWFTVACSYFGPQVSELVVFHLLHCLGSPKAPVLQHVLHPHLTLS